MFMRINLIGEQQKTKCFYWQNKEKKLNYIYRDATEPQNAVPAGTEIF